MTPSPVPPRLAVALVWMFTPALSREPVLGDLAEEYVTLCQEGSLQRARAWYWNQALRSLPHLTLWSMRYSRLLAGVMSLAASYAIFLMSVSLFFLLYRQAYAINFFQGHVPLALGVRLGLEGIAMFASGCGLGLALASSGWRDLRLVALPFCILVLAVSGPAVFEAFRVEQSVVQAYLWSRVSLGALMLMAGTWLGLGVLRR